MILTLGDPIVQSFVCRDQNNELFDPPIVLASFLKVDINVEDVLRYGGTNPFDDHLTRVSTGYYSFWYSTDALGVWKVAARWIVPPSGNEQPVMFTTDPLEFVVQPITNTFTIRP